MKNLPEMEQILALRFQQKQQVFSKILNEEGRLRAQLSKLNEQERVSDSSQQHHHKAIGADVIWKAWLSKSRTSLNLELAQVLVQKNQLLSSVRKEYGKLLISQALLKTENSLAIKQRQKSTLTQSIESHLLRSGSCRD